MKSALSDLIPARSEDRWFAGVAGGIAARLGVEPVYVRAAFVAFGLLGFAVYVVLLVLTIDNVADRQPVDEAPPDRKLALALIFFGALLLARELSLVPDFLIPAAFVLFGAASLWDRSTPAGRSKFAKLLRPDIGGGPTIGRTIGGLALLVVGMVLLLPGVDAVRRAGWVMVGAVAAAAGAAVLFGPWLYRLGSELREERAQRVRADARAEVAAHLHDSVLQTLALIQRAGDDSRRMVTLARSQERELRNWLYQGPEEQDLELEPALSLAAAKVEQDHDIPINVVVVGDAAVDHRVEALVGGAKEAMVNAAKHSGTDVINVYAEVTAGEVEVFVTDQGRGFDVIAGQKQGVGITGSIVERMARKGGTAEITSSDEGTEVYLRLPMQEQLR